MKAKLIFSIVTLIVSFFSFSQINKSNSNLNQDLYSSLEYRLVGPFRGGRAGTAVGVANNSNLYYMGTAGGGVWKTEDSGNTWQSISDGFFGLIVRLIHLLVIQLKCALCHEEINGPKSSFF